MKTTILQKEEMYELAAEIHNPPHNQNQKEENAFQAEIKAEYQRLVECLSFFGEEGDYYGVSDFAVRPSLREWPTVKPPPAQHDRKLCVYVISRKFYRSNFLQAIHEFLSTAAADYQVEISTDFDPELYVVIYMTSSVAKIFCENSKESSRLQRVLTEL